MKNIFVEIYQLLLDHFGVQRWWPADSAFEVMVGAVLTQNTNWSNVEKAIVNLKEHGLLSYEMLSQVDVEELAELIRPSGYYNLKAKRLKNLLAMIKEQYNGQLDTFLTDDFHNCRENLLEVKGVGPETADSILLYAAGHAVFLIDAYTHRVFSRHNLIPEETDYHSMQETFMTKLPEDIQLFNEYHALIVRVATTYCKKTNPLCENCPLQGIGL